MPLFLILTSSWSATTTRNDLSADTRIYVTSTIIKVVARRRAARPEDLADVDAEICADLALQSREARKVRAVDVCMSNWCLIRSTLADPQRHPDVHRQDNSVAEGHLQEPTRSVSFLLFDVMCVLTR